MADLASGREVPEMVELDPDFQMDGTRSGWRDEARSIPMKQSRPANERVECGLRSDRLEKSTARLQSAMANVKDSGSGWHQGQTKNLGGGASRGRIIVVVREVVVSLIS